jgi:hypothetical protein
LVKNVSFWHHSTSRDVRSLVAIGGKADLFRTSLEDRV